MRITWNATENRFEAEFAQGELWRDDQQMAQACGFKTVGPPSWQWYAIKSSVLSKLRLNKPKSGLTITPEALLKYNSLKLIEDANAVVKAQIKEAKKKLAKDKKYAPIDEPEAIREGRIPEYWRGKNSITRADLPERCFVNFIGQKFEWTGLRCSQCDTPVCFFETQEPPTCMWCETELEKATEGL